MKGYLSCIVVCFFVLCHACPCLAGEYSTCVYASPSFSIFSKKGNVHIFLNSGDLQVQPSNSPSSLEKMRRQPPVGTIENYGHVLGPIVNRPELNNSNIVRF